MRGLIRLYNFSRVSSCPTKLLYSTTAAGSQNPSDSSSPPENREEEFRTLELYKKDVRKPRRKREVFEALPPRYKKMSVTQDWPSVWPVARSFHPATVPLPLHQGFVPKNRPVPNKFGNLELMKIPNFLHLTPPAIQRHCEVLKKFCTPWPENLRKEEAINKAFPLEVMTNVYCHSSASIRDPRARIVTLKFKLSVLNFDEHAKDKFLRLVGERYDVVTDTVTIVTDCCPLRVQNLEYAMYLLTALYHESWNTEDWEDEKIEDDMEKYVWDKSLSQKRVSNILATVLEYNQVKKPEYLTTVAPDVLKSDSIDAVKPVKKLAEAIATLHNEGETLDSVAEYGKSVRALLNLPPEPAV